MRCPSCGNQDTRVVDSRLIIEVEDDGVGMGGAQLEESSSWAGMGIGMANISERLQVLYGDTARMTIDSHEGKGTTITLELPRDNRRKVPETESRNGVPDVSRLSDFLKVTGSETNNLP